MKELVEIFDSTFTATKAMIIGMAMILVLPIRISNWCCLAFINLLCGE